VERDRDGAHDDDHRRYAADRTACDPRDQEVEAAGALPLVLVGAVADVAEPVEEDGLAQVSAGPRGVTTSIG
jgi:hypothetical protein